MYLTHYAYYCDRGTDQERCLQGAQQSATDGWSRAEAAIGNPRMTARMGRGAVLGAASALRCTESLRNDRVARRSLPELPLFVAGGTGLSFAAHFAKSLTDVPVSGARLETALFTGAGPYVVECMRSSATIMAGLIAQLSCLKGENRSLSGSAAGFLALTRADRFLASNRATQALVVCSESMLEWAHPPLLQNETDVREIGCALLVSTSPIGAIARLELQPHSSRPATESRYPQFEAVRSPATVCWALEHRDDEVLLFSERDLNGKRWQFAIQWTSVE